MIHRACTIFCHGLAFVSLSPAYASEVGAEPAPTEEIVAAIKDCAAVVTPGAFDGAAFKKAGWQLAKRPSGKAAGGISADTALFAREGGNVINTIQIVGGLSATCQTTARIASDEAIEQVRSTLISDYSAVEAANSTDPMAPLMTKQMKPADKRNSLFANRNRFFITQNKTTDINSITILMVPKRVNK